MRRRHPERAEQYEILRLLTLVGAQTWVLGTTRRRGDYQGTMQSPGLPDLITFLPARLSRELTYKRARLLMIEVKAGSRLSPAQAEFQRACEGADVSHLVGGINEVIEWLMREGYLRADQIAHDRKGDTP